MKDQDPTSVDSTQIQELIASLEQGSLSAQQMLLIKRLLRLLLSMINLLEQRRTSITRLKRMLFGPASDKRFLSQTSTSEFDRSTGTVYSDSVPDDEKLSETSNAESTQSDSSDSAKQESRAGGHGRNPASAYTAAHVVSCTDPVLQPGQRCPDGCCTGHLYDTREPAVFIRLEGQPLVGAIRYDQQVLRCSACQTRYTAALPEGVSPEKYSPTADAALALAHYGAGLPFHRIERQQQLVGVPLPASVQFERCEQVADALLPVYREMVEQAASAGLIYIDDTGVKILECEQEKKLAADEKAAEKQRKTFTTGIVAQLDEDEQLALYFSGSKHAGENLSELLLSRPAGCAKPIQMADALSSNWKKESQTIAGKCWAHARRQFIDIETKFPLECGRVLDTIAGLYKAEAETVGMSSLERLKYHQKQSAPKLEQLREWIDEQLSKRRVEANSSLGKAFVYLQRHWKELTEFLRTEEVPLDNNTAERSLKRVVLLRKNSYFYKSRHGAAVGDILMSVIESCRLNAVNAWEYLLDVLANRREIRRNAQEWLPSRWKERARAPAHAAA